MSASAADTLPAGSPGEVLETIGIDEVTWAVSTQRGQCVREGVQGNTGV